MSRDWTPHEHYAVEQWSIANGHGDRWDFLANTKMYYNDEVFPICPPEELELRKKYPLLGKFVEDFLQLHEALSKFEGGLDLLRKKDDELALYIKTGEGDSNSYLIKWFEGKLDPCFYYAEYNHELFYEKLLAEAAAINK